jgi:hypothetical protein
MLRLRIKGTEILITEQQKSQMKYFEESEAIHPNLDQLYQIDMYPVDLFQKMIDIMELAEYDFPDFPAIKTNNLSEVIG